jgi:hypothetical protein
MAERIYLVTGTQEGARLVKANSRQQALNYVASTEFNIRVATQDDLVNQIRSGTEVEQYRAPEQQELIEDSESPAN